MGYPVDDRYGLVLLFAEFSELPALLAATPETPGPDVTEEWQSLLGTIRCNTDHVADEEVDESPAAMAADAWRLAKGLELVAENGLTEPGRQFAALVNEPIGNQTFQRQLGQLLAQQIQACYFRPGRSVAGAMQAGAQRMAASESGKHFPGLLLIEAQALIEWAHTDQSAVNRWIDRLEDNRTAAVETYGFPDVDLTPLTEVLGDDEARRFWERTSLADAITNYYLEQLQLSGMTLTEIRSTAMLLTYAGLLEERHPVGPVQCLCLPSSRESRHDKM